MRHRLYVHVVWTTRDRAPSLDAKVARFLWRFLRDVARQERAVVLALGMVSNHVHLLLRIHPMTSMPRLLQRLKGGSAVIGTREKHAHPDPLRWGKGYAIVSVSPAAVEHVQRYVRTQHLHHPEQAIPGWPPVEPENRVPAARERMLAREHREPPSP
jgi:REP element-mobilizing transposase RayT